MRSYPSSLNQNLSTWVKLSASKYDEFRDAVASVCFGFRQAISPVYHALCFLFRPENTFCFALARPKFQGSVALALRPNGRHLGGQETSPAQSGLVKPRAIRGPESAAEWITNNSVR